MNRIKNFFSQTWVKFISISILICILIMVQLLYIDEFNLESIKILNGLYFTLLLGGYIYGYITSKINLIINLSFGKTRRQVYVDFIKRIVVVLIFVIFINFYYILMYGLIHNQNNLYQFFGSKELIYFVSSYILFSSFGFTSGYLKFNDIATIIFMIVLLSAILIIKYFTINFIGVLAISVLGVIDFIVNYYLMTSKHHIIL